MAELSAAYEMTYRDYIARLGQINVGARGEILGGKAEGDDMIIPLYGVSYRISPIGITDPEGNQPTLDICVILCKYLLLQGDPRQTEKEWTAFREFKSAGPLTAYFANEVERAIANHFSGKLPTLKEACRGLKGVPVDLSVSHDLVFQFMALPKVPVVLLFNDRDDEFPARCSVLFDRRADQFLDAECLSMAGRLLFRHLKKLSKG